MLSYGAVIFFLIIITGVLYAPVKKYGFSNLDDPAYVMENQHVLKGFTWLNLKWIFTHTVEGNWHPLTMISLMLDGTMFGSWAGGYHVTNVILHIINTVLLLILLERMTGSLWRSAFVCAVFAWHPLHVEPVAWISSRKDVLSTAFLFLTLLSYVAYARKPRPFTYLLILILFVLGLTAKPMLITLPFLLLLLDYWPLGRLRFGQDVPGGALPPHALSKLIIEKLPLLGVSALFSVIAFIAQGKAVSSLQQFPLWMRIANVPLSYVRYLRKLVWPDDLAIFYPYPQSTRPLLVLASVCGLLAITLAVLVNGKRRPYLPVGWFWYLVMLLPVIGIVQLGGQAIADRYTYVSFIGLFIAAAWVIPTPSSLRMRWSCSVAVAMALTACVISASTQLGYWKDNISLFSRALEVTASNSLAHYNLALAYMAANDSDHAIEHLEATVQLSPNLPTAWNNLGISYFLKGRLDKAADQFEMALKINPEMADAHNNLANILTAQGRLDEAIDQYREALRMEPDHPNAERNLRNALAVKQQRLKE